MIVRLLPRTLQLIAEQELNETPYRIHDDISTIRKWLESQPHLKARTDDQWLLTFLTACKFSLERTKHKLEVFYSMRTVTTDIFSNRDPFSDDLEYYLKNNIMIVAPIKEGEPVRTILRVGACDPERLTCESITKLYFMFLDIIVEETDNCQISGLSIIIDYKGLTYKHVLKITPNALKNGMISLQNSYPIRLKSMVIIHMPSVAVPIYKLLQTLLSNKLSDRLHAYVDNGGDAIYDHIPFTMLPEEYGGGGGSINELTEKWNLKVKRYRDWFINDEKFYSDETMRLQNFQTTDNLFGMDGSFRKLNID